MEIATDIIGGFPVSIFVNVNLAAMYDIVVAALGMVSSIVAGSAIEAYGPISDKAGGIAEMAGMSHRRHKRTNTLDAAGNTTAAIGKGLAMGSTTLVSLTLFDACVSRTEFSTRKGLTPIVFAWLIVQCCHGGSPPCTRKSGQCNFENGGP
ncbi:pyrophosphate-energized vacuolar membrane proton pump-like [Aristolochia californica]|uniref:pyrophosphate-energized vacuolar membrane proton pump-like n=1 Tax=Aristolochia californica TaxID=171875 RepID=UPI0035E3928E